MASAVRAGVRDIVAAEAGDASCRSASPRKADACPDLAIRVRVWLPRFAAARSNENARAKREYRGRPGIGPSRRLLYKDRDNRTRYVGEGYSAMPMPVVICDDSAIARKQIARALPRAWEADIVFAADGREALEAVRAKRPALMFLDLTMPVMDGFQVLDTLTRESANTRVIVVSGDIQPDARRRVMELGALEFLRKPVDEARLEDVLRRLGLDEPGGAMRGAEALDVDLRDCYREVANVAMGQAADLLARLLDVFVILPVPQVNTLEASELHMALAATERYDSASAVCQGYIGEGIAGEALLIFNDASFEDIARLMRYSGILDGKAELELLMDVANILIGACLRGIAHQLDIHFSQGHPTVLGRHRAVSELIAANAARWRRTLAVEINYRIEDYRIDCDLLLLFTEDSVSILNQKIAHMLNG